MRASSTERSAPCERTEPLGLVEPCAFGPARRRDVRARRRQPRERAALGVRGRGGGRWAGAATRSPATAARTCATAARSPSRRSRVRDLQAAGSRSGSPQHPEVTTVFVIGLPRNAASQDPANWLAAWQTLPGLRQAARRPPRHARAARGHAGLRRTPPPRSPARAAPSTARTALAAGPRGAAAEQRGAPLIDLVALLLRRATLLPRHRRRARLPGPHPCHSPVRVHARPVPGRRARRLG